MATVFVDETYLEDIADAIRSKNSTQNTYKPSQMADAIIALPTGGITPTGTISITSNNTYDVTQYASAEVDVPQSGITPTGTISITSNNTYDVTQYASAEVNVPQGITPTGTKSITANGTGIDVADYAYADVAVPNTYAAGDEGKVVSNGALVAQTSDTVTENDTYDTTLINSLTVNVSGGGGSTLPKTGSVTPASRTTSVSFDVGITDTIKHVLIIPTETPLKSGGKTVVAIIANAESSYYKYIGCTTNNAGSSLLTPATSTSSTCFTQSGSTITVTPTSAGYFESISYTWFAW